jgi:hypothetical protein
MPSAQQPWTVGSTERGQPGGSTTPRCGITLELS